MRTIKNWFLQQRGFKPKGKKKQVVKNDNRVEHPSLDTLTVGVPRLVLIVLQEENTLEVSHREVTQAE